jgi:hypothetical protein
LWESFEHAPDALFDGWIGDSLEHAPDALFDGWSGEANEELMEGIHHQLTSTGCYHPYHAPSHTCTTNVPTPSCSNSGPGLPDHVKMEDHVMSSPTYNPHHIVSRPEEPNTPWPDSLDGNTFLPGNPVRSFEHIPVDDRFFEGLPTMDKSPEYLLTSGRAASEAWKTTDEWSGLATSPKSELPSISHQGVPLLDRIRMYEQEVKVHQLNFNEIVLNIPDSGDDQHIRRKNLIEKIRDKRKIESGSNLSGFVIKNEELYPFMTSFIKFEGPDESQSIERESTRPSHLVARVMPGFCSSSQTWMDVYHSRLGINFEAVQKWAEEIFGNTRSAKLMSVHFLSYIFLVDTIITILPQTSHSTMVNRNQIFRMAVTCFERKTEQLRAQKSQAFSFNSSRKKMEVLWSYIAYWLTQDVHYNTNRHLWVDYPPKGKLKLHLLWKCVFNFILTYSIDSLTSEKQSELLTKS